jgi:O-antigen biosynthesis protein WbqP
MQTETPVQGVLPDTNNPQFEILPVKRNPHPVYLAVKRCFDIVVALMVGLFLLLPMLVIALIIKLDSPGPALFKQERMGKDGKVFTIYKFRSMRLDAPSEMASREFSDSSAYITKFGAFIRRTSLDELPQLINILNGTMSWVGYRPVCLTETELNELRRQRGVFAVRPGLTGLAQVRGRDNVSPQDKAEMDAEYVEKCGVKMDLWCLLRTVTVVFSGEGVM